MKKYPVIKLLMKSRPQVFDSKDGCFAVVRAERHGLRVNIFLASYERSFQFFLPFVIWSRQRQQHRVICSQPSSNEEYMTPNHAISLWHTIHAHTHAHFLTLILFWGTFLLSLYRSCFFCLTPRVSVRERECVCVFVCVKGVGKITISHFRLNPSITKPKSLGWMSF